jgi:hypothetical protein
MKKLLSSLVILLMPFVMFAQMLDTTEVYYENFDGAAVKMISTTLFGETNWRKDSTLHVSLPASFHTPSYASQGNSACWTHQIEVDRSYPYVYLQFDHICKINNNDRSYLSYQLSTSVNPQGEAIFGAWVTMNNYNVNSPYYHGHAEVINDGNVSQNWYTIWQKTNNAAVPNNTWWKRELFDMSQFVVGADNQYFRIRFHTTHNSGAGSGTEVCAGWYIDNVKVIYSNVELVPPEINITQTSYINNNGQPQNRVFSGVINDFTGPFTVNATLTDNDAIDTSTVRFWYTTSNGDSDTLPNTIEYYQLGYGTVAYSWTIPMQCYGTTVTYHIFCKDIHGNNCYVEDISATNETRIFALNTTQSLVENDAKMEQNSFALPIYPDRMTTGETYPIKVTFRNKGLASETNPNHMTSATFGWSVNGVQKPGASWAGDLCLDYTDTIVVGYHTALRDSNWIRVWVSSRNNVSPLDRRTDDTIYYDGYGCDSSLSGTYTLGGPTADFPTVKYMKERFHRCGLDGPVTININAGTYTGFDFDDQYPGLDSINTITFQPAPGVSRSAVIIENLGNEPPVKFKQMAYITIRNVTIRNNNVGRCVEFVNHASHDITIDNCVIQGTLTTATPYYNSSAIGRTTAPQTQAGGTGDYNMTFTNNIMSNVDFGVYFIGGSQAAYKENNFVVNGNTINCSVTGISAGQSKAWTIDGNQITQMATAADMNFMGISLANCTDFASMSGNRIHMNQRGGTGISTTTYANSNASVPNMVVANNEIIGKVVTTGRYNIMLQNTKQVNLYHNSSYLYSLADVTQSAPMYLTGASSSTNNINIYNNVFYNASTSAENKNYAIYLNYTTANGLAPTVKLNNNEYYSVGNSLGWFVAPRNNFAEWQAALASRGDDTTSVNLPVEFVAPTDSLIPVIYDGLECPPVGGITVDIRGHQRYQHITYMGCYTRAIPATDLAITALTSPSIGNECPMTQYPIKVMLKNTGSADLNFATKNATIYYTIGTTTGSSTVTSGVIAPLQSQEVTVVPTFPVNINTVYNYVFVVHVNGDNNTLNDTLTGSFEIQAAFPYYEEVFSTVDLYPSWRIEQITGAGNWTVELGSGVNPTISPSYGLGRLFFNSKLFANNTESRAIMPVTILQGATTPILEYWFAHDNVNSSTEGITVKISTDGGTTYTAVNSVNTAGATSTFVKRYNNQYPTPGWAKYMVDLAPYCDLSCVYIAFDAKSNAKNNINIDRVVVRNFYNTDIAVNDIWALGVNPTQYEVSPRIYVNISNEGRDLQTNFPLMLEITGANTYRDTITVSSLATRSSMVVYFDGVHLTNPGDNVVRIYCQDDQDNSNNEHTWLMTTVPAEVGFANDSVVGGQHYSYSSLATGGTGRIAYVNKYTMADTLIATHVKAFITNTANNSNIGRHFRFIVVDASGNVIESSEEFTVTAAMENQWVTGEINNFALTSTNTALYVGIEMLDGGTYLGVQEEAPLRDTTYYTLANGTLSASTVGRQMVNAILESYMPYELALNTLVNPVTNCDLGHEDIVVNMTNNGANPLPAGTPIYYSINGLAPVAATINMTIASHETVDYTFPVQFDFTNNLVNIDSTYNIVVWVETIGGDRVRFNDTLATIVVSYGKAPMPTAASPVHANYHESAILTATDATSGMIHAWYTNSGFESWDLQFVGDPFITPTVYYDTTYYVTSAPGQMIDRQVGTLTPTTASNNITQPFVFTNGYSRGKILYKASEMQNPTGKLTSIELYVASTAGGELGIPMRLYVMNTDLETFPTTPVNTWNDDVANATLIYDGNYYFSTTGWTSFNLPVPFDYEGGNIIILTETHCGGTNCALASGSTTYPSFNSTAINGCVLYKSTNNNESSYSGNYSTGNKRLNMKFHFMDADCQSEKVPVQVIADNIPIYDVEPVELVSPVTNTCTLLDEHIVVTVRNLINNTIPANTVEVKAKFNNNTVSHIIDEPFSPNEVKTVTFTNTVNLSAPTADVTYNYIIVTDLIGTAAYRGNDTIRGSIVSKKTYYMPADTVAEGEYLHTYTILCQNTQTPRITKWFYKNDETGDSTLVQSNPYNFTTPVLYDTAVYYVYGITPQSQCTTRHMRYQINVITPSYDLSTNELKHPLSYQCGISNPHLKVNVSDTWPTADTIPANTFKLKADFTDTTTNIISSVEHTINQPITSDASVDVVFGNTITLGSTTRNNIYNYVIYSNPVDAGMYVYRNNDTISGTLYVPATPETPANIPASATYGGTATINPSTAVFNQFYFYDQPTGGTAIAQGTSFTTPPIIENPTLFYYSGRILDAQDFSATTTVGTATVNNNYKPFDFTKEHSVGIIMYTQEELGFSAGIIDTLYLYVHAASTGELPAKLYLKNDTSFVQTQGGIVYPNLTPALMNTLYQNKWSNAIEGAMLIADGIPEITETGWYAFVIPGGFHYTGHSLLLLTEHHGKNTSLGYTAPIFRSTNVPSVPNSTYNKRVISYATDNAFNPSASVNNYTQATVRFNTKFNIGYSCETASRGVITVSTVLPNIDLDVQAIVNPVTPNNNYSNNETVTVQLSNHGSNTASIYDLSYQLEGQTPVTVSNPVAIPSGNTVNYSFTTTLDLSDLYFPRTFKVYVSCTADNHPENDTITIILTKDLCESGSLNAASPSIENVTFAGINNVPLPAGWSPFNSADTVSYTNYAETVAPAILVRGQSYPFSVTNAFVGNSGVKLYKYVFIDFNRDGEFNLSGANSERVVNYTSGSNFNNQHPELATTEAVITVPETATEGTTLMRVVASTATNEANTGCGYYAQGETEDYAVVIRGSFDRDLAVVGYLQPAGSSCPDHDANVKVYVKNYGTTVLHFTQSNPLELVAEVSGPISGTYNNVFSTGSIAPGETKTYTIPNVNVSTTGSYSVVTTLNFADDEYTINNFWKTYFTIGNMAVDTVPFLETFDEAITDPDNPFSDFWHRLSSSAAYKWDIRKGASVNEPNAGPVQDHTLTNTEDQYALVLGKTNQTSPSAYATLTTNCLDLHYRNGYPIQLDYWEHIFGQSNATGTLLVQVGTGDNFITVDSVVGPTQTASNAAWKQRIVMFSDNDEVAKVRFRTKAHTRLMDIALDDVNFGYGRPDIGIAYDKGYYGVFYPTDFNDTAASCMVYGDTVHPRVAIVNTGLTPVDAFNIKGTWKAGNDVIEYVEHWEAEVVNGVLQPFQSGDTMEYTFTSTFTVFNTTSISDFTVELMLDLDQDPFNDKTTIHPCSSTGIDDYVKEGGLVLNQNVPNPADDKTRITFLAPHAGQAVMEIFSVTGQKLYSVAVNAQYGENFVDVPTASFAEGMYIYTLQFEDTVLSKKMVIQR